MNLAYLQTGISGVFFGVLNFKNLYFLGTGHSCCIFFGLLQNKSCILKCFIFSAVFFWVQFYPPGASIIIGLHYYHIMLDFCEMYSVIEGIFQDFAFWKVFFGFSASGKVFFGSFRNTHLR